MKRTDIKPISEVLKERLKELDESGKLSEMQALAAVDKVLGKGLMNFIEDKRIKDGVLMLKTQSSALRNEIFSNRTQLKEQINKEAGNDTVKEIRLY